MRGSNARMHKVNLHIRIRREMSSREIKHSKHAGLKGKRTALIK